MRDRLKIVAVGLWAACTPPGDAGPGGASGSEDSSGALPTTGSGGDPSTAGDIGETGDTGGGETSGSSGDATTGGDPPSGACPEGDASLWDQADVDAVAGCQHFPGRLTVLPFEALDLSPLAGVKTVAGALQIGKTGDQGKVTSLAAFSELEAVGGLEVTMMPVSDLLALSKLTEIPGDLTIFGLDLASLEGLHNITAVGGSVRVSISDITDLNGLRGLQKVGRELALSNLTIADFTGLEGLTELGQPGGEPALLRLSGLADITSLAGLSFPWHDALGLDLYDSGVTDLGALAGVTELHGLRIVGNAALASLAGLESLVTLGGELHLQSNAALTDLGALAGLESVGGLRMIGDTYSDLSAFPSLHTIGSLYVQSFEGVDLAAPPMLAELGDVHIRGCEDLVDLSILVGFGELGSLTLRDNPGLSELPALANLTTLSGELHIRDNQSLVSLGAVGSLQAIGGRVAIVGNTALPQVDAVAWAEPIAVGGARKIAGNKDPGPLLDPCPWFEDGECDEPMGGAGICGEDLDGNDCCPGACE